MSALTGLVSNTKGNLVQVPNSNLGFDSTIRLLQDGLGNNSALGVSTAAVQCGNWVFTGGTASASSGALTISSNITFSGSVIGLTVPNPFSAGTATVTLGGSLTTVGAYTTTLTSTNTTSVTLPTAGTLATLAGSETLTNKILTSPTINSPVLTTPALGTPASGVLTSCTGLTVAGGGTGLTTLTNHAVILGAGSSTPTFVAPSTSGNVLTSNGTTWQSTAPAAGGVTSVATAGLATGGTITTTGTVTVTAASKSDQQTGTSTTTVVTPAQQQSHTSAAKFFVYFQGAGGGGSGTVVGSYNVTSVTRNGTGDYSVNFTTNFANTSYVTMGTVTSTAGGQLNGVMVYSQSVGSVRLLSTTSGVGANDMTGYFIVGYGTQ